VGAAERDVRLLFSASSRSLLDQCENPCPDRSVGESGAAEGRWCAARSPFDQMQAAAKLSREKAEAMMAGLLLTACVQAREAVMVRAA
jgi:hypothetical protein